MEATPKLVNLASMTPEERKDYTRDGRISALAKISKIEDIDFTQEPFNEADFSEVYTSRMHRNVAKSRDHTMTWPAIKTFLLKPLYFLQFLRQYGSCDIKRWGYS